MSDQRNDSIAVIRRHLAEGEFWYREGDVAELLAAFDEANACVASLEAKLREAEAERAVLIDALIPFANMGAGIDIARSPVTPDERIVLTQPGDVIGLRGGYDITVGDLRKAAQALTNVSTAASALVTRLAEVERAVAFKDETNRRLQECLEGEVRLKAELSAARQNAPTWQPIETAPELIQMQATSYPPKLGEFVIQTFQNSDATAWAAYFDQDQRRYTLCYALPKATASTPEIGTASSLKGGEERCDVCGAVVDPRSDACANCG